MASWPFQLHHAILLGYWRQGWALGARFEIQYLNSKHLGYIIKYLLWNGRVWIIAHCPCVTRGIQVCPHPVYSCRWDPEGVEWDSILLVASSFMEKGVYCTLVCQVSSSQDYFVRKRNSSFLWSFECLDWGKEEVFAGERRDATNCWAFPDKKGEIKGRRHCGKHWTCSWMSESAGLEEGPYLGTLALNQDFISNSVTYQLLKISLFFLV